jgi:Flp pilus assembly protein TadD
MAILRPPSLTQQSDQAEQGDMRLSRKRCILALVGIILATYAGAAQAQPPRHTEGARIALVIGNDQYEGRPLKNAINDAKGMAAALAGQGFRVISAFNADVKTLSSSVNIFMSQVSAESVAVVFYSGHGFQLDGENFMVPVDFTAINDVDARYQAYPISKIADLLSDRRTRLNVIMLDACRDNPFRASRSSSKGLATMNTGAGTYVAFATAPGRTASDNQGENHGLFTKYILQEIGIPGLGLDELFGRVRKNVFQQSNGQQLPWTSSSLIGSFSFVASDGPSYISGSQAERYARDATDSAAKSRSIPEPVTQPSTASVSADLTKSSVVLVPNGYNGPPQGSDNHPGVAAENGISPPPPARPESLPNPPPLIRATQALAPHGLEEAEPIPTTSAKTPTKPSQTQMSDAARRFLEQRVAQTTEAIEAKPEEPRGWVARSATYLSLGFYEQAARDADQATQRAPDLAEAWRLRGISSIFLRRLSDALIYLTRAIDRDSLDYVAYHQRAIANVLLGENASALDDCTHAVMLSPSLAISHGLRALILIRLGRGVEADNEFAQAARLDPHMEVLKKLYLLRTSQRGG